MLTKKESKLLVKIKKYSLTLYTKAQLPRCLVSRIQNLTKDSNPELISFYSEMCDHYLRVVGYYRKYPSVAKLVDRELSLRMKEKGI